jgi:hypothetical protein
MLAFTPRLVPVVPYVFPKILSSLTLSNTALDARVEGVSRKERQHLRLPLKPLIVSVVVYQRLEPRVSPNWLSRASFDVVHIVVVQEAKVRRGIRPTWWRCNDLFLR